MIDYRRTIRLYYDYVVPSYVKVPVVFARGKNTRLWDARGKEYLDFFSGFAVSNVGHCHPKVVRAIRRQAAELIHVPNGYYHENQARLAERIIRHAFPGKVFFSNSGAEAVEGAIKLARRFGHPDRFEIITLERSFHGRTMGALSATGQTKFHEGMGPLLPGFRTVPLGDFGALERAVTPRTAAVLIELIQGEGGVRLASREYVERLRRLCDERNLLLIFDEVQTGMGRTGKMFCFKNYGIAPDVMTLAKGLGGGFPIGAVVAAAKVADVLQPGTHATTFGGSPLACAAALAVFDAIESEKLAENAFVAGGHLLKRLGELQRKHPAVVEVRGLGLLAALELSVPGQPVYEGCLAEGLLINVTQTNTLRFAPPLTIREKEIDRAVAVLDRVLGEKTAASKTAGERAGV
jgi:predicted acetylornithine/succinylornithine family transaminase